MIYHLLLTIGLIGTLFVLRVTIQYFYRKSFENQIDTANEAEKKSACGSCNFGCNALKDPAVQNKDLQ